MKSMNAAAPISGFTQALQRVVVSPLVAPNQDLRRNPGEETAPPTEDQRLPKPADAPAPVTERMNMFNEEVHHAGHTDRVRARLRPPLQQLLNKSRHL